MKVKPRSLKRPAPHISEIEGPPRKVLVKKRPEAVPVKTKPGLPIARPATDSPYMAKVNQRLHDQAKSLDVHVEGQKKVFLFEVLATANAAPIIDITSITLANWIKDGMFPAPILRRADGRVGNYYHVREIQVVAELLLEHRQVFKYYRRDHLDLKRKLFSRIATLRQQLFQ